MVVTQYFERPAGNLLYFTANSRPRVASVIGSVGQVPARDTGIPIFNHV
jgi:hypothetical protein